MQILSSLNIVHTSVTCCIHDISFLLPILPPHPCNLYIPFPYPILVPPHDYVTLLHILSSYVLNFFASYLVRPSSSTSLVVAHHSLQHSHMDVPVDLHRSAFEILSILMTSCSVLLTRSIVSQTPHSTQVHQSATRPRLHSTKWLPYILPYLLLSNAHWSLSFLETGIIEGRYLIWSTTTSDILASADSLLLWSVADPSHRFFTSLGPTSFACLSMLVSVVLGQRWRARLKRNTGSSDR
jgi:hypothetical protein